MRGWLLLSPMTHLDFHYSIAENYDLYQQIQSHLGSVLHSHFFVFNVGKLEEECYLIDWWQDPAFLDLKLFRHLYSRWHFEVLGLHLYCKMCHLKVLLLFCYFLGCFYLMAGGFIKGFETCELIPSTLITFITPAVTKSQMYYLFKRPLLLVLISCSLKD